MFRIIRSGSGTRIRNGCRLLDAIEFKAKETGCFRFSLLNLRERESYQRRFYAKRNWVERKNAAKMIKETN